MTRSDAIPNLPPTKQRRVSLGWELESALESGQIVPYFQPIVELRSGHLAGYELLARWNHPERGLVPPNDFIPLAEAAHFMPELTDALLVQAIRSWHEMSLGVGLSINISPSQLQDVQLPQRIIRASSQVSFPLELLTIEITESALLDDIDQAQKAAHKLAELGCKLALDDFGTGYSSLSHLQKLPFNSLKIDQSFVRSMVQHRDDRKIVGAVVGLGKSLGLKLVAEGIEDRAQAEMLLCLGCDYGQGWLYGKPLPAHELTRDQLAGNPPLFCLGSLKQVDPTISLEALPAQTLAQMKAIYDGVPVGLCFLDRDFHYVTLNKRLAAMNGLSIDEHLGRSPEEIVPEMFRQAEPYLIRARAGEIIENVEISRPDRERNLMQVALISYRPAFDEVGEVVGILVSTTDITERKRTETDLKESLDHYASMVALSPQIPWTMNADGSHLEVSPRWEQLTGFTVDQIADEAWLKTMHPDDRGPISDTVSKSVTEGLAFDVEYRILGRHQDWHWARSRGTPRLGLAGEVLRWYGCIEIIDQQREIVEQLRESRAHVQSLLDVLPAGVAIPDAPSTRIMSMAPSVQNVPVANAFMTSHRTIDFKVLTDHSVDLICSIALDRAFRYVSPSSFELLGWHDHELVGRKVDELVYPADLPVLNAKGAAIRAGQKHVTATARMIRRDGALVWMEVSSRLVRDPKTNEPLEAVVIMRDITERKRLEEKLSALALTDGLTGIGNRRAFDEALAREWNRTLREGSQMSLLLLDIDHFKKFNDNYGHLVGDDCLRAVASAIVQTVRATDIVARYGGEEIAVILPLADTASALHIAEKIRSTVEDLKLVHSSCLLGTGKVTASIGVATALARHGGTMSMPESLLMAVDGALYKAKREGRNRIASALLMAPQLVKAS